MVFSTIGKVFQQPIGVRFESGFVLFYKSFVDFYCPFVYFTSNGLVFFTLQIVYSILDNTRC